MGSIISRGSISTAGCLDLQKYAYSSHNEREKRGVRAFNPCSTMWSKIHRCNSFLCVNDLKSLFSLWREIEACGIKSRVSLTVIYLWRTATISAFAASFRFFLEVFFSFFLSHERAFHRHRRGSRASSAVTVRLNHSLTHILVLSIIFSINLRWNRLCCSPAPGSYQQNWVCFHWPLQQLLL